MPNEVDGVRAEGGLGREGERAVVEVGEFEVGAAGQDGFGDVGLGDLDAQVVVDGPLACIWLQLASFGNAQTPLVLGLPTPSGSRSYAHTTLQPRVQVTPGLKASRGTYGRRAADSPIYLKRNA